MTINQANRAVLGGEPKRTRAQAAELVLRSMIADMRRQGWTLSDDQADEMVARLRKEILQRQ